MQPTHDKYSSCDDCLLGLPRTDRGLVHLTVTMLTVVL